MTKGAMSEAAPHPRVLCIDDELVGLKIRTLLLERAGYEVFSADEGAKGLDIFAREPVEAVVLDFAMPGMNGGEVATRMREIKPHVPILLLSAYVGLPEEVTDLVDVYMTKGEGAPHLLEKLNAMLSPELRPRSPNHDGKGKSN